MVDNPTQGLQMEGIVEELHRSARRRFPRRRYILYGKYDLLQADLIDFRQFKTKNSGYSYILVVIDCFSKVAYCRAVKNKTGELVTKAMADILREIDHPVRNLQSDAGKEFVNKHMRELCRKNTINAYSTYSHIKAAHVERLIRTLKMKLFKRFDLQGTYRWFGKTLKDIVYEYNNTVHSTIKLKPIDVDESAEARLKKTVFAYRKLAPITAKFRVGDPVRISKFRTVFEKPSHTQNWSREVFEIARVQHTQPPTYILRDRKNNELIRGGFYEFELQHTLYANAYIIEKVIRRKGDRMYVKFFDYPNPEWINKSDLVSQS